ncbi:MAG TPA: hypothetical protein VFS43_15775 [Polyangiaceae bacterium]|nr:hypothetical protein [Polyangiaceae bacterium]
MQRLIVARGPFDPKVLLARLVRVGVDDLDAHASEVRRELGLTALG